jgi:hypothetical protein
MQLNPEATFDSLFLADRLQRETGSFTVPELHLFAYLACLLWLYRKRAVTDWGYPFVGTELGAPFSQDIDDAVKLLLERGYLLRIQERLFMSKIAGKSLEEFGNLDLNQDRGECLRAACASTAAFSIGMVGSALSQEPDLKRARTTPLNRVLLEDSARDQLYTQFDCLRSALRSDAIQFQDEDLRMPAVLWLAALYRWSELIP